MHKALLLILLTVLYACNFSEKPIEGDKHPEISFFPEATSAKYQFKELGVLNNSKVFF